MKTKKPIKPNRLKNLLVCLLIVLISSIFISIILLKKFNTVAPSSEHISILLFMLVTIVTTITVLFLYLYKSEVAYTKFVQQLAFTNHVTHLSNLNKLFMDFVPFKRKHKNKTIAAAFLDIDNFKFVNDSFGRDYGDMLLQKTAKIMKDVFDKDALYCNIAIDLFIIVTVVDDKDEFAAKLKKIPELLNTSDDNISQFTEISPSIGVYIESSPNVDLKQMLDKATIARKSIKNKPNVFIAYFDDMMLDSIIKAKEITSRMAYAIENDEFEIYLQPKFNILTNELIGAEALSRWNYPQKGILAPNRFIPIFESNGFIIDFDYYVLEKVCQTISEWSRNGYKLIPISVNISQVHLSSPYLVNRTKEILEKYNIEPSLIEIELTESASTQNNANLIKVINNFKSLGISVSIDDFGAGYSSLALLKKINIDLIKIDREFIKNILIPNVEYEDYKDKAIIESIVGLAKNLDIQALFEGVETNEQVLYLKSIGCELVQGFVFSRPIPIPQFVHTYLKTDL